MLQLQIAITFLVLILFFAKLRIGICAYLAYMFLVPYCQIPIGGVILSWNILNIALLVAFFVEANKRKHRKFDFKPFYPFLILYGCLLLLMPFEDYVPINIQLNSWRLDIFMLILPFVLWNTSKFDPKLWKYCIYTMVVTGFVIVIYALSLTSLGGLNPYIMLMADINGGELQEGQFGSQETRLMIKISSVFTHPMIFGAFLGMFFVYLFAYRKAVNKYIIGLLILGILSCIFICGIRTPIAAIFVAILTYLLFNHNFKEFVRFGIVGIIAYYVIMQIPELSGTIESMTDKSSQEVGGSSLEMRLEQLDGCFKEIQNCWLVGKGYGYTAFYMSKYTIHPVILCFESLIFVILCNWGFLGCFIWALAFYKLYQYAKKNLRKDGYAVIIYSLIAYYLSYTIITGEYGYMKFFMIFYSLILIKGRKERA